MKNHIDFFNANIEPFSPAYTTRPLLSVKYPLDPTFSRFLEAIGALLSTSRIFSGRLALEAFEKKLIDVGYSEHTAKLICNASRKAMSRGAQNVSAND